MFNWPADEWIRLLQEGWKLGSFFIVGVFATVWWYIWCKHGRKRPPS